MNFEKALKLLKLGKKITRTCWNDNFIYYIHETKQEANNLTKNNIIHTLDKKVLFKGYIAYIYTNETVIPWNPTHQDLLSNDWKVID